MHRTFISTVVAAALAITSISASMVQAGEYRVVPAPQYRSNNGNEAVAGALAGLAALFIIGKTIENNGGFKKKSYRQDRHVERERRHHKHKRHHHGHKRHHGHYHARPGHEWHRHSNGYGHRHAHGRNHHPSGH